jgi:hypothetical protein
MPEWVSSTASSIVKGITLTVPTPLGPVQLTPQQAAAAARGSSVSYTPPRPGTQTPFQQAGSFVEQNVPGGWGTVALAAGAGLLLVLMMGGRGRR